MTDSPLILSGDRLAVFDPHHHFASSGGLSVDFTSGDTDFADQLAGFNSVSDIGRQSYNGTIIRLPLRNAHTAKISELDNSTIEPALIRQLMADFVRDEIAEALLFLTNVSTIELRVAGDAETTVLARATISPRSAEQHITDAASAKAVQRSITVVDHIGAEEPSTKQWLVSYFTPTADISKVISDRLGYDVEERLARKKLRPDVALAFPLRVGSDSVMTSGRLFTYLPLPIPTHFPCHVHALFALTPDRQHLVNADETGLPDKSDYQYVF